MGACQLWATASENETEGSEEERELLASVASTPDQKNMQFVYLLGVGKFYTFDANNAQTDESSHSSTAMESLISNTISGQLNNMLGKIINSANNHKLSLPRRGLRDWKAVLEKIRSTII